MSYYLQTLPLLLDIYQKMNFWLSVTILIPGFVLNLMMAGIFTQKKFWTTTMGYYFTLYPLLGNLAVAIGAVNFLAYSLGVDLTLSNYASCYIIWVCRLLFITGIQYFQVQVTLDRAVNVVYPRRFLWLTKTRNLSIITGLIYLILFVYSASSQSFRSIAYTTQTRNNVTVVLPTTCNYYSTPLIVNNILFCVIRTVGFVVCFLANLIIVKKLIDSKKSLHGSASRMSRKQFYFASALMASNFIKVKLSSNVCKHFSKYKYQRFCSYCLRSSWFSFSLDIHLLPIRPQTKPTFGLTCTPSPAGVSSCLF